MLFSAKSISKEKLKEYDYIYQIVCRNGRETAKKIVDLDNVSIMDEVEEYLKAFVVIDFTIKEKIEFQQEFLGYISFMTNKEEDRTKLLLLDVKPLISKRTNRVWQYCFRTMSFGSGKTSEVLIEPKYYENNKVEKMDTIKVNVESLYSREWNGKKSWYLKAYKKIQF